MKNIKGVTMTVSLNLRKNTNEHNVSGALNHRAPFLKNQMKPSKTFNDLIKFEMTETDCIKLKEDTLGAVEKFGNWGYRLKNYKDEKITIGDILAEIHPIVFRFNKTYLSSQTYFLLYANPEKGNIFKSPTVFFLCLVDLGLWGPPWKPLRTSSEKKPPGGVLELSWGLLRPLSGHLEQFRRPRGLF